MLKGKSSGELTIKGLAARIDARQRGVVLADLALMVSQDLVKWREEAEFLAKENARLEAEIARLAALLEGNSDATV